MKKKTRNIGLTGCPAQAKAMPPQVAETITITKLDINLRLQHLEEIGMLNK